MADDVDIAPDGVIYFSDATKRYDIENWGLDLLEGRPNGRLLSYDPKTRKTRTVCDNLVFPNGVCLTHDGEHLLVASTWTCSLLIFDLAHMSAGPRVFVRGLPGYPDNVNRASDGGYWIALAGMRNPVTDLAMRHPGVRRRMTAGGGADPLAVRQPEHRRRPQDRPRRERSSTPTGTIRAGRST